mgnify:CR=1 FL=1
MNDSNRPKLKTALTIQSCACLYKATFDQHIFFLLFVEILNDWIHFLKAEVFGKPVKRVT